jgi:hypothetical protein
MSYEHVFLSGQKYFFGVAEQNVQLWRFFAATFRLTT